MNYPITCEVMANKIIEHVKQRVKPNNPPKLVTIVIGDDPATGIYMKNKRIACEKTGIEYEEYDFGLDVAPHTIELLIYKLNGDPKVSGILIQKPCPIEIADLAQLIEPTKDVDGLTPKNISHLYSRNNVGYHTPCTAEGVIELLNHNCVKLDGKHMVIVGRSDIVGKPVALLALQNNCTVTICHSWTSEEDLRCMLYDADIIVTATGVPHLIKRDMLGRAKYVVDCGISRLDGKIVGDCEDMTDDPNIYYTPVPGGVGKLTVANLIYNTYISKTLYERG